MTSHQPIWRIPVRVDEVPEAGRHFDLHADAAIRDALAHLAGVHGFAHLDASFDLSRHGPGIRVVGTVSARVRQTCVITLEPVENDVEETIDVVFVPGRPTDAAAPDGSIELSPLPDGAAPEPLQGDTVDLGALATEFLVLAIDPYPRKPGAVFEPAASADTAAHPFAALAALKKADGNG